MMTLALSVLIASAAGSPHCAGMCGGFVCFVAGRAGERRMLALLAYHLGRFVSYVGLGALAGVLGAGLDRAGEWRGVSHAAALGAGLVMLAWGGAALARALGARLPAPRLGSHRPIAAVMRRLAGLGPGPRALAIGLLTTLLPCGWLWLFVATAAGTGSPWASMGIMAMFWAGTLPMMLGLGVLAHGALAPLTRRLPVVSATILMVLGLLTLAGKFRGGPHLLHVPSAASIRAACVHVFPASHGGH